MKISTITIQNYKNNNSKVYSPKVVPQNQLDVVRFTGNEVAGFKKLTSKTIKMLYNTDFIFSGKNYGQTVYPTFVLDKITQKPVEVVVVPHSIDGIGEEFYILDPNNGFKRIGRRLFGFEGGDRYISTGSMNATSQKFIGIGIRLHQIALERMKMKNIKNVEIYSTAEAYPFHKKAGFEPIHDTDTYSPRSFLEFVKNAARDLRIDSESLKKLLVYREEFDDFLVDTNSTVRNFIEYMYQNPAKFEDDLLPYCVYMRLSPEALNEWDKFIDKSPIFINKKLPIFYKVGN